MPSTSTYSYYYDEGKKGELLLNLLHLQDSKHTDTMRNRHTNQRRRLAFLIIILGSLLFDRPSDVQATNRLPPLPGILRRLGHVRQLQWTCSNSNNNDSEDATATSKAIQILVQKSLAASISCRGGYKDDVAVETDIVAVGIQPERLDSKAKSKEYGELEFSLFQKGDGSDEDPDGIPDRYLRMQLQNREKARKACELTLEWRQEKDIDHILQIPHPDFDVCKAVFPHYFVGRDVDGHMLFVQRPALLNLELAAKNGLDNEHLLSTSAKC